MNQNPPRSPRWIIWLVVAFSLALAAGAAAYGSYSMTRCGSCHSAPAFAETTLKTSHAAIACAECHVSRGAAGKALYAVSHLPHMLTPLPGDGRQGAAVSDSRCTACHEPVLRKVVAANGVRIDHIRCAAKAACTDCHSATAHGSSSSWVREYEMETCLECHSSKQSAKCDLCHEGRRTTERITTGTFAITHGPDWKSTHGMGDSGSCNICHTAATCKKCHGSGLPHEADFVAQHAPAASADDARCSTCHEQRFCNECHGTPMPHDRSFTREHGRISVKNENLCKRCHADPDCTQCHEKHVHPGGAIDLSSGSGAGG